MTDFNLSAARMMRAMRVIEPQPVRAYLTGALIEPLPDGGALIVATQGRIMLVQYDREATAPRPAILRVAALDFRPDEEPWDDEPAPTGWDFTLARVTIPDAVRDGAVAAPVRRGSGSHHTYLPFTLLIAEEPAPADLFPKWRQVFTGAVDPSRGIDRLAKHDIPADRRGLNTNITARMSDGSSCVRLQDLPGRTPYLVTFPDDPDSIALQMPVRVKDDAHTHCVAMLERIGCADILTPAGDA